LIFNKTSNFKTCFVVGIFNFKKSFVVDVLDFQIGYSGIFFARRLFWLLFAKFWQFIFFRLSGHTVGSAPPPPLCL
jgi:hypothetical protein